jgi:hypothetical protein
VAIKFYFAISKLKILLKVGNRTYHHAVICQNGHVISASLDIEEDSIQYCDECGKETIYACQECNQPILGWLCNPHVSMLIPFKPRSFCRFCGKLFPWTKAKIKALEETIDFEDSLTEEEKKLMKSNIDDIINETPRTEIASMKFKKGLAKAGKESAKIVRNIIVDIASETGKKILLGNH